MTLTATLRRLYDRFAKRRPVVVQTYKTKPTKLETLKADKTAQLAAELGWPWPLNGRKAVR